MTPRWRIFLALYVLFWFAVVLGAAAYGFANLPMPSPAP